MFRATCLWALAVVCISSSEIWTQHEDANVVVKGTDFVVVRRTEVWGKVEKEKLCSLHLIHKGLELGGQFRPRGDKQTHSTRTYGRLPLTYHFPLGPVGMVLDRFNWFAGDLNTYSADTRLPASLAASAFGEIGCLPTCALAGAWSEPPVAVFGIWAGALASYARPYQHMDIFERQPELIALSAPAKGKPVFTYIQDAKKRGAIIRIFQSGHRSALEKLAADGFYHVIVVECSKEGGMEALHERMLTREAMSVLDKKLAPQGILCYHTSHQFINIPGGLIGTARNLGWVGVVGLDMGDYQGGLYRFVAQWVVIAKQGDNLLKIKTPPPPAGERYGVELPLYWNRPDEPLAIWKDADFSFAGLYQNSPQWAWLYRLQRNAHFEIGRTVSPHAGRMAGGVLYLLHYVLDQADLLTLNREKSRFAKD